jgi:hypothetical protein
VGLALALPSPVLSFVLVFEFIFVFEFVFVLPRRPLLPRRVGVLAGVPGGIGPASAAGVAGVAGVAGCAGCAGCAGVAGIAGVVIGSAGVAGTAGVTRARVRRVGPARDERAGVNAQTWPESGTGISVSRSPDFFARIEIIMGVVAGCVAVAAVDSPNCIATPV